MIKIAIIIGLGISTTVLGVSTGYLAWERTMNKAAITALAEANTSTNANVQQIIDTYNLEVASGKVFSNGINADLSKQLDSLVADYNATAGDLATANVKLEGKRLTEQTLGEVVDELNAANARVAELEAQVKNVPDIQRLVNEINTANSRVVELETQLAAVR